MSQSKLLPDQPEPEDIEAERLRPKTLRRPPPPLESELVGQLFSLPASRERTEAITSAARRRKPE